MQHLVIQSFLSGNSHLGLRIRGQRTQLCCRNGLIILDSDKTLICLRNACAFIGSIICQEGRIIFLNTNSFFSEILDSMKKRCSRARFFISNSPNFVFNFYECLVLVDAYRHDSVILEADRKQIPIVSLVDSQLPLESYQRITYPIPVRSSQGVYLFCNLITKFDKRCGAFLVMGKG